MYIEKHAADESSLKCTVAEHRRPYEVGAAID